MAQRLFKHLRILTLAFVLSISLVSSVLAQDFIQGYQVDSFLVKGSLVSSIVESDTHVQPANDDNNNQLLGIVVKSDELALSLTTDTSGVFIASSGKFLALVSDVNGPIRAGEYITSSPITGVGMASDSRQERIVGIALQDLDLTDSNNILSTVEVKDQNGNAGTAAVGKILIEIRSEENPKAAGALEKAPEFIINVGESLAGKPISPLRIYAAMTMLFVSLSVGGFMLYGTIRSSFTAIGRNPLAKDSVISGLRQVFFVSILIFGAGLFTVYLILRL